MEKDDIAGMLFSSQSSKNNNDGITPNLRSVEKKQNYYTFFKWVVILRGVRNFLSFQNMQSLQKYGLS